MSRTEIQDLGEFGLIGKLTEGLTKKQPSSLLGVGDDAAVIDPLGKRVVVSTDLLVEGVHFELVAVLVGLVQLVGVPDFLLFLLHDSHSGVWLVTAVTTRPG